MMIIGNETDNYNLYIFRVEGSEFFHAQLLDNKTQAMTLLLDNIREDNLMATVKRLARQWFPEYH